MLMAFADGELTGPEAEAVAAAIAADPALAEKVAQHRQLRAMLAGAFEPVLDEPLPAGLAALAKSPGQAAIVDFAVAKERRSASRAPFLQLWGAIADTLADGIVAGHLLDFYRGL